MSEAICSERVSLAAAELFSTIQLHSSLISMSPLSICCIIRLNEVWCALWMGSYLHVGHITTGVHKSLQNFGGMVSGRHSAAAFAIAIGVY